MARTQSLSRRAAFAIAIALAVATAPAVAVFAGAADTPRVLADPDECTASSTPGDNALNCAPDAVAPDVGAPGEMQLTDTNPGIVSPEHGGR
jgi:hypothetical protein